MIRQLLSKSGNASIELLIENNPYSLSREFHPLYSDSRGVLHHIEEKSDPYDETTPSSSGMLDGPAQALRLNLDL